MPRATMRAKTGNCLAAVLFGLPGLSSPPSNLDGIVLSGYDTNGIDRNYDRRYDVRGFDRRFDRNSDRNFDNRGYDRRLDRNFDRRFDSAGFSRP